MTTSIATSTRAPSRKELILAAGRAHLKEWLLAAEAHGTIYYNVDSVSRSGMSRKISLATIYYEPSESGRGAARLVRLWPGYGDQALPEDLTRGFGNFGAVLDVIARDWGFSFKSQSFVASGCGMDMVFWLVDHLAHIAGVGKLDPDGDGRTSYANRVKREAF